MLTLLLLLQDAWRVDGRSLYVWEKSPPAELLRFCAEKKVARLYYMYSGKEAPVDFIKAAKAAKIQVHAMHPGDLADWLDPFPKFDHKIVIDWVKAAVAAKVFDGLHLDVEPHGHELWPKHKMELAKGYLELLKLCREAAGPGVLLSAAVPWHWEKLDVDGRPLSQRVQDALDWVSIMAYRGANAKSVIAAIEDECAYRPGRVELILETDRSVVEEGVPLHVGTETKLEAVFAAARERFPGLMEAVHHFKTWKELPK